MSTPGQWSRAYARQAQADFASYQTLSSLAEIPQCHKLQFLQMACEKLAKADLCANGSKPEDVQSSHAYSAKQLPIIAMNFYAVKGATNKSWTLRHIRHIAREIELLAPAVKAGGQRPDNCEYPWEDATGKLQIPCEHNFTNLDLLVEPVGRTFLKLIHLAIDNAVRGA